jgi:hypothetical protein
MSESDLSKVAICTTPERIRASFRAWNAGGDGFTASENQTVAVERETFANHTKR